MLLSCVYTISTSVPQPGFRLQTYLYWYDIVARKTDRNGPEWFGNRYPYDNNTLDAWKKHL